MAVRYALLPDDIRTILDLLKYIDLSAYPTPSDIENPDDQWFIYEENGIAVGTVAARKSNCEIRHVVVLPDHQNKGIGSQLVRFAIEFLKKKECTPIWAQVRVNNKESRGLFEHLGFDKCIGLITSRKDPSVELYRYVLPH